MMRDNPMKGVMVLALLLAVLLAACDGPLVVVVTSTAPAETNTVTPTVSPTATATATVTASPVASSTPEPTLEASATIEPTLEPEPTPTRIPDGPTPTPLPDSTPLLEQGSFEPPYECVTYEVISGCVPDAWSPVWADGGFDFPTQTTQWFPPEFRPVSRFADLGECKDLPHDQECPLVFEGNQVLKIFSRGSTWGGVTQSTELDAGVYTLTACFYPDQVISYTTDTDGQIVKLRPSNSSSDDWYLASRVRLFAGFEYGPWHDPIGSGGAQEVPIGEWSCISHTFHAAYDGEHVVGLEVQGRWGFANNGWFVDNVSISPASALIHTVVSGDSWWKITNTYCGDGNLYKDVQERAKHTGSLQPGQEILVYCP